MAYRPGQVFPSGIHSGSGTLSALLALLSAVPSAPIAAGSPPSPSGSMLSPTHTDKKIHSISTISIILDTGGEEFCSVFKAHLGLCFCSQKLNLAV